MGPNSTIVYFMFRDYLVVGEVFGEAFHARNRIGSGISEEQCRSRLSGEEKPT